MKMTFKVTNRFTRKSTNTTSIEQLFYGIYCLEIKGRSTVKSIIRKCVTCRLIQARCIQPPPTPLLPEHRVSCDFPFQYVGVDYAGPLYVRDNYSKSAELFKAYILVFTCATTRCTHLELGTDFTIETLILAIKRFLFRRGKSYFFHK